MKELYDRVIASNITTLSYDELYEIILQDELVQDDYLNMWLYPNQIEYIKPEIEEYKSKK